MEKESIFDNKNFASNLEHEPFSMCLLTVLLKSVLIFSMSFFASSHDILLYVMMSYNCLWHSLTMSDLSALIGPKFLSVSLVHILTFLFLINTLSDLFSVSKRMLMASLVFQQKLFTAVYFVGGKNLFLRQNVLFFSKLLVFILIQKKIL